MKHKQLLLTNKRISVKIGGSTYLKQVLNKNIFCEVYISLSRILGFSLILIFVLIISGCNQKPKAEGPVFGVSPLSQTIPVYHFATHPLHNPAKLIEEYQPLMDYLNKKIKGVKFTVEASRDYGNFEEKYRDRNPEFILPNPWQTLQAIKLGYNVIAMAGEPDDFILPFRTVQI